MRRSYRGMAPRTTLTTMLADRLRTPVEELDLDGIRRVRAQVIPARPPFSWVTGPVARSVVVTTGAARARDGHQVPLRVYRPRRPSTGPRPVVVYLHGGGWVLGNLPSYDPLCSHLATEVDAVVVSVDYRMAPEHPAPVAAHDAVDATRWVAGPGALPDTDAARLAVSGDSAGGNLAAVLAQVLRDAGESPVRHQALIYPATDLTMSSPSIRQHAAAPILTKTAMDAFLAHYCPPGTDLTDPLLSPLFGDLDGLPPALVQTADLDPIRDDGTRYAAALRAAGVPVRRTNYLRVPHGFASFPGATLVGEQQRLELVTELREHLHPAVPAGQRPTGR